MTSYILLRENGCTIGAVGGLYGDLSQDFMQRMSLAIKEHFCEGELELYTSLSDIQEAITNASTISVNALIGEDREKVVLVISPLWVY